jgi:Bacterial capsule synthesis protein PGA_cap
VFMGEARGHPRAFARAVVEAGADLVVGHGPHVVRAAECIQGRPVVHSVGNFVGSGGLSVRQLAQAAVYLEAVFDPQMALRGVRAIPVTFNAARWPVHDPSGRGMLLMNWLSRLAQRELQAFEPLLFPGFEDRQPAFEAWRLEQSSPPVTEPRTGGPRIHPGLSLP